MVKTKDQIRKRQHLWWLSRGILMYQRKGARCCTPFDIKYKVRKQKGTTNPRVAVLARTGKLWRVIAGFTNGNQAIGFLARLMGGEIADFVLDAPLKRR